MSPYLEKLLGDGHLSGELQAREAAGGAGGSLSR